MGLFWLCPGQMISWLCVYFHRPYMKKIFWKQEFASYRSWYTRTHSLDQQLKGLGQVVDSTRRLTGNVSKKPIGINDVGHTNICKNTLLSSALNLVYHSTRSGVSITSN